jgi:MFS family permease
MREHLDIGRVFSAIADLYKNNVGPLLGSAVIIFLVAALLTGLLFVVSPILVILSVVVGVVAQFWYQGMVIELVNRVHAGAGVPGIGELFSSVTPRLGRLIVAGILAGLGIAVGLILILVPGLYLLTIWAVIAPVIVIEGAAVGAAFGRSQQLVKGDGWQVFAVLVILFIINFIISFIVRLIVGSSFVGSTLGSFIPNLLLAPVSALAAAVIYFELRRIREGAAVGGGPGAAGVSAGQPGYPPGPPQQGYEQPPGYPPQGGSAPTAPYQQPPGGRPPSAPPPSAPPTGS